MKRRIGTMAVLCAVLSGAVVIAGCGSSAPTSSRLSTSVPAHTTTTRSTASPVIETLRSGFSDASLCSASLQAVVTSALDPVIASGGSPQFQCADDSLTHPPVEYVVDYSETYETIVDSFALSVENTSSDGGNAPSIELDEHGMTREPSIGGYPTFFDPKGHDLFVWIGKDWSVQVTDISNDEGGEVSGFNLSASREQPAFMQIARAVVGVGFY